jgi:hypothetical protein
MNPQRLFTIRIGAAFTLMMLALLAGCPSISPPNGRPDGPPSGVVEMDQNTDPRFNLRHRRGRIGWLKIAGNEVRLNGRRVVRDTYIQNGTHVTTGPASAAIIDFLPSTGVDCGLEIGDFRHGRIFGLAEQCGHLVVTEQGAMETRGWPATYHVEARGDRETVFTAIGGEAAVWRHAEPERVVFVPSYHQVRLSRTRISPPRRVSPGEVASITRWRENFQRWREESQIRVPDLRKRQVGEVRRMLDRIGLGLSVTPDNAGSRDRVLRQDPLPGTVVRPGDMVRVFVRETVTPIRVPELRKRQVGEVRRMLERLELRLSVNPPNAGSGYRVVRQSPRAGTEVRPGMVIRVDARAEAPTFTFPAVTVPSVTTPAVDVPKVTVPNLRSRSLADARKILERLGLELRYSPRNAAENYWVVGQDPPAGRKVDRGASVNLKLQVPIY